MHTFLLIVYCLFSCFVIVYFHCLLLLSALLRALTFQALSYTLCNLSPNHNTGPENQKAVSQGLSYLIQTVIYLTVSSCFRCRWLYVKILCPGVAGPRINQLLATYCSKNSYVLSVIYNWTYILLLLRSRVVIRTKMHWNCI
jgi:hypothetical protein